MVERHKTALGKLREEVATRIKARQSQRPPRKTPVSDSRLPADLANKVDDLIRLFADSPVMEDGERERLARATMRAATTRMLEDGLTYGQASGAPEFL